MKKPPGPRTDGSAQSPVDLASIERLASILSKYDLTEVEIDLGELHVRLARDKAQGTAPHLPEAPAAPRVAASLPGSDEPHPAPTEAVKSPMVGTAYLRPTPEAKPFIELGSIVKVGDKLLLVEAMKTFNDIVAPRPGKIVEILVTDGSPVEYDQPLVMIE